MTIDELQTGSIVRLQFLHGIEQAACIAVTGEGEERRARFVSYDAWTGLYGWEAYRFEGEWAYGTSADPLVVLSN